MPLYNKLKKLSDVGRQPHPPLTGTTHIVTLLCFTLITLLLVEMSDSEFVTAVELPVVFTYGGQTQTFNRQPDGKGGGGSIGVWRAGNRAWKLFSKTTSLEKNRRFYETARDRRLPIGTPTPTFQQGTVKQGTQRATQGYALISQWLEGKEFNFQTSQGAFRKALENQNISHSRGSPQYQRYALISILFSFSLSASRILAACNVANEVHLIDVQGKVNGAAGVGEPLAFFDINLAATHSEQAVVLVEVITAWGTHP